MSPATWSHWPTIELVKDPAPEDVITPALEIAVVVASRVMYRADVVADPAASVPEPITAPNVRLVSDWIELTRY